MDTTHPHTTPEVLIYRIVNELQDSHMILFRGLLTDKPKNKLTLTFQPRIGKSWLLLIVDVAKTVTRNICQAFLGSNAVGSFHE